ncbi:ABC transporter ATP-binding protein [Halomonas almeriensis]|uniref:ABC transporter ATP-binding protein n=1 Tax=Halomonas almeriensis TaxID=308163 RepID=UPI0025B45B02|nr:ABC transporter ATP-binding protein [Halomonas almeriensis]MDN3554227.1 ABC transporter ATP-binding protein [Halomonas almeriensis]
MIELMQVSKRFGDALAVDDVSLNIARGELCVLIGTSGCGKSTTLRMINRLIEHSAGEIHLEGQPVREFREEVLRRRIGYAIQSTGLFPHWTVARNIGLVPGLLKWPRARIRERVEELMALLGLEVAEFADKYPSQLSGGQAQRVGVARALAADPDILLMDEPFGALDPITRESLQDELIRLQARLNKTIVFVTHDMDEALRLADRLVVMNQGRIIQQGHPLELLRRPADGFVESLLGGEDRGLKEAALLPVSQRMVALDDAPPDEQQVAQHATLREALSIMLWRHTERLTVVDEAGRPVGQLYLAQLVGINGEASGRGHDRHHRAAG